QEPALADLRLGVLARPALRGQAARMGAAATALRPDSPAAAAALLQELDAAVPCCLPPLTLAGRRVLVVDDDPRNIFTLTSALESHGLEVVHAEGGRAALAMLEAAPPGQIELAYLDIMMPEFDGYQTLEAIRSRPGLAHFPVIALTAKAMRGDRERCLEAGASDYLAKPVEMEALLALTRIWLPLQNDPEAAA
ncbi:MAG: response regulator, partial [Terriglobales bacterium]